MNPKYLLFYGVLLFFILSGEVSAQQFNTDNYLTMPYDVSTFCITAGTRNALLLPSFSLVRNWEFLVAANLIWKDEERGALRAGERFADLGKRYGRIEGARLANRYIIIIICPALCLQRMPGKNL